ncbi:uncharacterized protein LOC130621818 [Hydractinia symbiolongicarpus]|uniref:uncharacterized protein LOC130621818 n=1 Tax=Hydractinia symbiolongicarpus TaxID=13093 RepID=UPI00254B3B0C|nr:uncharacterized protein LOC130621818 [Hydractinia symbiolongicarpus]
MENLVKRIVRDEMQNKDDPPNKIKNKQTETRLGSLLKRIRTSNSADDVKKEGKEKHVNVKWKRADLLKGTHTTVTQKHGGGHRFVVVNDFDTVESIKEKAINHYFPEGTNFFGESRNDCEITIRDASGVAIDESLTLKDCLKNRGVYISKFYFVLHTKYGYFDSTVFETDVCSVCFCQMVGGICRICYPSVYQTIRNIDPLAASTSIPSSNDIVFSSSVEQSSIIEADHEPSSDHQGYFGSSNDLFQNSDHQQDDLLNTDSGTSQHKPTAPTPTNEAPVTEVPAVHASTSTTEAPAAHASTTETPVVHASTTEAPVVHASTTETPVIHASTTEAPVVHASTTEAPVVHASTTETQAVHAPTIDLTESDIEKEVIVHRTNIRADMVEAFKTITVPQKIKFVVIDARGEKETGIGIGVDRDIYSSVWQDILDGLCVGHTERVPFVRHDFYLDEWSSIATILVKGYYDTKYFPMQLCKAFIMYCLFGNVQNDNLIQSFLNYLTPMESKIVDDALHGKNNGLFEDEEFLDILDRFNCKSCVTIMNVYGVILEIARQELIQRPYLMVCSWTKSMNVLRDFQEFSTFNDINLFYKKILPTNRKVVKILNAEPKNAAERECFDYLKQFIRGLDEIGLKTFLRFCTGSDVLLVEKLRVEFVPCSTAARRPIAHTCAPMLEMPSSYSNFCEFRAEMHNILSASSWSMDII